MFDTILAFYWKPKGFFKNLKSHLITLFLSYFMFLIIYLVLLLPFGESILILPIISLVMTINHILMSVWARIRFKDTPPNLN